MSFLKQGFYLTIGGLMLATISGCNTSTTKTVDAKPVAKTTDAKKIATDTTLSTPTKNQQVGVQPKETAKVINKPGKVANRGTFIRILVNNVPITNFDIQRRVAFLKLRRVGGDRAKTAENELIEQTIKLSEARRRGTSAADAQVDTAFAGFAKQNKTTPARLTTELNRMGVGAEHFKDFMRTQISWQGVVTRKFQADTQQLSQLDAITQIRKSGNNKPELAEYYIQQIVFVVPASRRKEILKTRQTEAKAFRQRFTTCDQTLAAVKTLRDVSVIEKRRLLAPEIPARWRVDVEQTAVGQTTKVQDTDQGVEFIAVCDLKMVNDDRVAQVASQSEEYDSFNEKGSAVSEEYLKELRSRATIVYR